MHGSVVFDAYAAGRLFGQAGVIAALDMTTEALVTKLGYLFSKIDDPDKVGQLLHVNLRGEVSDPSVYEKRLFRKETMLQSVCAKL